MTHVGIDLIEIERVRRALDRYPSFRARCFTDAERASDLPAASALRDASAKVSKRVSTISVENSVHKGTLATRKPRRCGPARR